VKKPHAEDSQLFREAVRDAQGLRDVVRMKYPTGALSVIELSAATWEALAPGALVDLILPSDVAG